MHHRQILLFLLSMLLTILIPLQAGAVIIQPGVRYTVDNEYYGVSTPIDFDNITIGTHFIVFNGLGFNITSASPFYLNFSSIMSHPYSITTGDSLCSFNASTSSITDVTFSINGLFPGAYYRIKDGTGWVITTTDDGGYLNFTSSISAIHPFEIHYYKLIPPSGYETAPSSMHSLFVVVIDKESNLMIANATVKISDTKVLTNANGVAFFQEATGSHQMTVNKTGYNTMVQNISLDSDRTITVYLTHGVKKGIPGFEMMGTLIALGLSLIYLSRRHHARK